MEAADILPSEMAALEMHGTGTALGDPIEIGAVCAVLKVGQLTQRWPCIAAVDIAAHAESL